MVNKSLNMVLDVLETGNSRKIADVTANILSKKFLSSLSNTEVLTLVSALSREKAMCETNFKIMMLIFTFYEEVRKMPISDTAFKDLLEGSRPNQGSNTNSHMYSYYIEAFKVYVECHFAIQGEHIGTFPLAKVWDTIFIRPTIAGLMAIQALQVYTATGLTERKLFIDFLQKTVTDMLGNFVLEQDFHRELSQLVRAKVYYTDTFLELLQQHVHGCMESAAHDDAEVLAVSVADLAITALRTYNEKLTGKAQDVILGEMCASILTGMRLALTNLELAEKGSAKPYYVEFDKNRKEIQAFRKVQELVPHVEALLNDNADNEKNDKSGKSGSKMCRLL